MLTDKRIQSLKAKSKPYKVTDERGLYLHVTPAGGKLWRLKFRHLGVERKLSLGVYPDLSLSQARARRDEARNRLASGVNPAAEKQKAKLVAKLEAANSFALVADEYIRTKMEGEGKAANTIKKARWFLELLAPALGNRPIAEIAPHELLAALKKLEARGRHETAMKCRSFASRVFRYGVGTSRCNSDPASLLIGVLTSPRVTHRAAILEPKPLGELLRAIDAYSGTALTQVALKIAPHVFVRPGELRQAAWSEFDLGRAVWTIPAAKKKERRAHMVPLSRQVLSMLDELGQMTGRSGYLFPSLRTLTRPMSDNTLNAAFRRMGFTGDEITAHGLRSTASTLLNESGLWNPDAIERALAHADSDQVRAAYARGQYWDERVRMAQWWSDYLDELKGKANE